ncbi:hypothetical protein SEMRO_523_G159790.1 [Seminavis robusta]|uniref:Uncharacterized protein n=1 Tax=Seminavis robusta TaxID=568900 RepID=A0A9N8E0C7_9STRA|nr:hypothetical protein SEMRO_523_G159790.1 [Seminavis robusta]|eukprot:Sro523_g159790.1 n/a (202) ;mRNA; r:38930-39846
MHNTRDFAFLDEFFNRGSGGGGVGCDGDAVQLDPLTEPDRSRSESTGVQNGDKWEQYDFQMNVIMDGASAYMEAIGAIMCPDDISGGVQTTCAAMVNGIFPFTQLIFEGIRMAYTVSAHSREQLSEETCEEAMASVEDVAAVYLAWLAGEQGDDDIVAELSTLTAKLDDQQKQMVVLQTMVQELMVAIKKNAKKEDDLSQE